MARIIMYFVWIVIYLYFGFSLQTDLTLADDLSDCNEFEYKLNGDTKCRQCPACPAGQMYTVNCGYTEVNGVIKRPNKGCKDCPPHHYKTQKSPYQCEQCTNRCPEGTRMIHPCNKTHDLKCTKCKKGFYTASDGSCVRCSICCGKPSIYGNQYVEHECESAGMGTCSCRPLQGCEDTNGICRKALFKSPTTNPSIKSSPQPTTESTSDITTHTTEQSTLQTKNRTTVTQKSISGLVLGKSKKIQEEKEQSFVTGWLVAIVIGIVLVATIVFHVLKHFNILKKIKVLLRPPKREVEEGTSRNDEDTSTITVVERFESPPRRAFTNYAQRIPPEEEAESQSDYTCTQQHLALMNGATGSLSDREEFDYSSGDPWVYRDDLHQQGFRMKSMKWPLTRAEAIFNPDYNGEYIEIVHSEGYGDDCLSTQGNNSGSLQQLEESTSRQTEEEEEEKGPMRVKMSSKSGQEHSDNEEPTTSIPATTTSGENTVVIATGQHRGMRSDELPRDEFSKGKRDKVSSNRKRKKRQPDNKKSKRPPDTNSMEISHDIFQCTCACSYRPYVREKRLCHCTDCVPQPTDDLYNIIERRCLRAEICKELNKKGISNWRELCTYIRIDKDISSIELEENPADIVLDKLKTSRPRLKLEDFNNILNIIKRQDIMEIIMRHHVKCRLCRRNSFDGSQADIHSTSDPSTWVGSKLSTVI